MPRCTVEEFVAVASGIVVIAAVQLGVMAYLELSGRTIWIITTVQRSLAATVFFYLTYKYCGQPKHVPVRSVGPNGEVGGTWRAVACCMGRMAFREFDFQLKCFALCRFALMPSPMKHGP